MDELRLRIRGADPLYEPKTELVIVENTQNICGGKVVPLEWQDELISICKSHKIKTHMDGARIFHAAAYLNVPVSRLTRDFDSITFCLSKFCAPVGAMLLGSTKFIESARFLRKALGGGMRQSGFLAAAALVALDEIIPNLQHDHIRAKQIAQAIYDLKSPFVTVDIDNVQTNIILIQMLQPEKYSLNHLCQRLENITSKELSDGITDKSGNGIVVRVSTVQKKNCIRYLTYYDITDELTELAIKKFKYCIKELKEDSF